MIGFKKAEWCLLAMWAKHPRHGLDGRGPPDSLCPLAVDCPWCTLCSTGPQLSSPWWSSGSPSLAVLLRAACLEGQAVPVLWGTLELLLGLAWWHWCVLACGCPALWGLPAVIHLQFLKHGALLSFVAASQHGVTPSVAQNWCLWRSCSPEWKPSIAFWIKSQACHRQWASKPRRKTKVWLFFPLKKNSIYQIFNSKQCSNFTRSTQQFSNFLIDQCPYFACVCIYRSVTLNQICLCFCDLCIFFLNRKAFIIKCYENNTVTGGYFIWKYCWLFLL